MELEGKIKVIFETQTFDSGFRKREVVITTEDQYPQEVVFQFVQDKVTDLDGYAVGDQIKLTFDVRGREYNGRYFVNLQAWRVEKVGAAAPSPEAAAPPVDSLEPAGSDEEDDLPF